MNPETVNLYNPDGPVPPPASKLSAFRNQLELLAVFLVGVGLMQYLYGATPDPATGTPAALPGNDDFYHLKMALLLPKIGLPDRLDWLQHTIFADRFVSHHYGFHVYLSVFAHAFTDPVIGARWAMSVSFGLVLVLATLLMRGEGVPHRWVFLALFVLAPDDFLVRHAYVRAIDLSLVCLLAGCWCLFNRRHGLLALTLAVYTHVYLGSFFLLILCGIHYAGAWLRSAPPPQPLRLPLAMLVGTALGYLTHPYGEHAFSFLKTQIFGSGLTPQVSVGREWNSYENVWEFANRVGIPLSVWAAAIVLALRRSRRLSDAGWTLLVGSMFFFALMLKARRFVEYWPLFAVLSSAVLLKPVLRGWRPATTPDSARIQRHDLILGALSLALTGWAVYFLLAHKSATGLSLWLRFAIPLVAAYVLLVHLLPGLFGAARDRRFARFSVRAVTTLGMGAGVVGVLAAAALPVHRHVRGWCRGNYDLPEVQRVMRFVAERSEPGDIIFTDDWDIFPVYFYYNDKNRYMAGLDPMFSYSRDAELWERYKLITRGQAPLTTTVSLPQPTEDGGTKLVETRITVPLEDIRDRWGARFVVIDDDHLPFARKLDRAKSLARRIYPEDDRKDALYRVYEILPATPDGSTSPAVTEP